MLDLIAVTAWFLTWQSKKRKGGRMGNHLTIEEHAERHGLDPKEVTQICFEHGIPIRDGKVCRGLLDPTLEALQQPSTTPLEVY
jgi:hypothetical protein